MSRYGVACGCLCGGDILPIIGKHDIYRCVSCDELYVSRTIPRTINLRPQKSPHKLVFATAHLKECKTAFGLEGGDARCPACDVLYKHKSKTCTVAQHIHGNCVLRVNCRKCRHFGWCVMFNYEPFCIDDLPK